MENIALNQQSTDAEFTADALEAVEIKFVEILDDIETSEGYPPEFAHQHFGDSEKIVGYKNLKVSVCYSDSSLYIHPVINYDAKVPKDGDLKADDIVYKIRDTLAVPQLDSLIVDRSTFEKKLREQKAFRPPGELISKFHIEDEDGERRTLQLYKQDGVGDETANGFLERAQSLAHWYIDAVCYTDYEDPRFFNYFLFENCQRDDGSTRHAFAGYATLYRFYHYPDLYRVRVAQILIAPSYRHAGVGSRFLNAMYVDLRAQADIYDITFEEPADSLLLMRYFVDCSNCCQLPEFAKDRLQKGFTKEMREAARRAFKLHAGQARRVYEILRLASKNVNATDGMAAFKADVCRRLERPMLRSDRDFNRLTRALNAGEAAVVSESANPDCRRQIVETAYDETLEVYRLVIDRLRKFNAKHFH